MKAEAILRKVRFDCPETGEIVVGLSGGADSVLLTYLLLQRYGAARLHCVHVHHGIRGGEADRDAEFVRDFCAFHSLKSSVFKKDVPALAAECGEGLEECARRVRYAVFTELAGETGSVATAHNADDNAETILLNLTRGMGPKGACGIPERRGNIYRPLLRVSRAEVEYLCAQYGLTYVQDSTNLDPAYTRNHLRHHVLPALKTVNPRMTEAVSRFTESMTLQQDYMAQQASALLNDAQTQWGYALPVLRQAHPALLRAALEALLRDTDRLSAELLLQAQSCVLEGGSMTMPSGLRLDANQDTFTLSEGREAGFCVPLLGEQTPLPDGRTLVVLKKFTQNGKNGGKVHNLLFKNDPVCDKITNIAVVRTRRSGDRFRPVGRGVSKSVKKLLNEMHIPAAVRDKLLLLELNGEILWIESVGIAEGWAADGASPYAWEITAVTSEIH